MCGHCPVVNLMNKDKISPSLLDEMSSRFFFLSAVVGTAGIQGSLERGEEKEKGSFHLYRHHLLDNGDQWSHVLTPSGKGAAGIRKDTEFKQRNLDKIKTNNYITYKRC